MKTLILPSRFHEGNWCSSSVRCEAAGPDDVSSHAPRTCVGQLMPAFIHFLKCLFCGSCLLQNKHHIGNSHLHSIFIRLPLNTLWVVFGRKAWSFGFKYNSNNFFISWTTCELCQDAVYWCCETQDILYRLVLVYMVASDMLSGGPQAFKMGNNLINIGYKNWLERPQSGLTNHLRLSCNHDNIC